VHLDLPLTPEKIWRAIHFGTQDSGGRHVPDAGSTARYTSQDVGSGAVKVTVG
jgi:hypothetical protein